MRQPMSECHVRRCAVPTPCRTFLATVQVPGRAQVSNTYARSRLSRRAAEILSGLRMSKTSRVRPQVRFLTNTQFWQNSVADEISASHAFYSVLIIFFSSTCTATCVSSVRRSSFHISRASSFLLCVVVAHQSRRQNSPDHFEISMCFEVCVFPPFNSFLAYV